MTRIPGNFGNIKITAPITIGAISTLIAILSTVAYAWAKDDIKPIISFGVVSTSSAATITAAFYVGAGLSETIKSSEKARTIAYASKWNEPALSQSRQLLRKLFEDIESEMGKTPSVSAIDTILKEFKANPLTETAVTDILNFLEEMAVFINDETLDGNKLKAVYKTTLLRTYPNLKPWIDHIRHLRNSTTLYEHLEKLYSEWKK